MICADTNVFVDFLRGVENKSTDILAGALEKKQVLMNPFVLSELLSSPKLSEKIETLLLKIPQVELLPGFFERSGHTRRHLYKSGKGVSIADIYIAQVCIDSEISLLTADRDLLQIARHSKLKLV